MYKARFRISCTNMNIAEIVEFPLDSEFSMKKQNNHRKEQIQTEIGILAKT